MNKLCRNLLLAPLLLAAGAAAAQDGFQFPSPFQNEMAANTCQNLPEQRRAADPRAMRMMTGIWVGNGMMPGTAGIMPDTPFQFRSTLSPNGAFQQDRYACFQMQSVPGMPPLQGSCATSMSYGEWVAHFTQDGGVVVVTFLRGGSGYNGQPLPGGCGASFFRIMDGNTLIDQTGAQVRRAG